MSMRGTSLGSSSTQVRAPRATRKARLLDWVAFVEALSKCRRSRSFKAQPLRHPLQAIIRPLDLVCFSSLHLAQGYLTLA